METKSIYELKCEALLKSLELINDYIRQFEFGEDRHFTIEDDQKCYNYMVVTIEDMKVLEIFSEFLFKDNKERTREELIDLQHKYMNLARKEIGNKPLNFSKVSKNDFLLIRKNKFDKEE